MEDNKLCQNPEDRIAFGKPMAIIKAELCRERISSFQNWDKEETQRVILDYALAQSNIFSTVP